MSNRPILDHFEAEESMPELYSRELIVGFTVLFSVLFGTIWYVYNLRTVGKWHLAIVVTALAILYFGLSQMVASYLSDLLFLPTLAFNLFAGLLLVGPLWKAQIGQFSFRRKSPLYPLLLAILIALGWLLAKHAQYTNLSLI
ncbi:MAG: hypothetical protein AAGI23_03760 [Bacteroidota bacterium]